MSRMVTGEQDASDEIPCWLGVVEGGDRGRRGVIAFALVVSLHVLAVYAFASGMARKVVQVLQKPVEVAVVEEHVVVPEMTDVLPPPSLNAPPPFVPLPEVKIERPPAPKAITTVSAEKPPAPVSLRQGPVSATARPTSAAINPKAACAAPRYPAASRRNGEEGAVLLMFLVDESGRAIESRVEQTSGHPNLDEAARQALSLCRFVPGRLDGKPVKAWAKIRYVWKIE